MDQLWLLASLAEAWGPRGEALGARVPQERLSALFSRIGCPVAQTLEH